MPEPLALANDELRQFAAGLREAGRLDDYKRAVKVLALILGHACVTEIASGPGSAQAVPMVSTAEAGHITGLKPNTILRRIYAGKLHGCVKHGRDWQIPLSELEKRP